MIRRSLTALVAFAFVLVGMPIGSQPAAAASLNVVVSQVYGGGGNTGATFQNDFVELFNRGNTTVSLAGWSIQYASATGTGNFGANSGQLTELSGSLAPGRYLLIQEASQAAVGVPLPPADITDATPINMSGTGGKVALVNTATTLGCNGGSTPCSPAALAMIVDLVGWDGANFFEGAAAAPTTSNSTAVLRNNGGCTDTDNNGADFSAGTPTPRNTASPLHSCDADVAPSITATSPVAGAAGVALDANISVTFSEAVNVVGSWFTIICGNSGAHSAAVSGGPTTFTLDPDANFAVNEPCTVTLFAANVTDQDASDPPDAMAANYVFSFNTVAPPTRIREIQGATQISPKVTQIVSGVVGVVTGKTSNGFWMQDPTPDADPATSEGIFVFTVSVPASVAVGDAVTVAGRVAEFRPGSAGLTITELTSPAIAVNSTGNPLPPAIVIGAGGRMPPTEVIEDDASGDVETSGVFDPANDGIDFWESLEGMRVDMGVVVVTGPSPFDELGILANNGAGATGRTARGGIVISAADKNPEKILMRGVGFPMPDSNTGDHFTAPIQGIVGYDFNNFMLEVLTQPTRVADGVTREVTVAPAPNELTVATFNVENLDPGDPTFATMANLIVNNLRSPDVISLEEIQDNDGETNSHIVDASVTLTKLRDAVVAAGGPTYAWRQIDPVDLQDGGAPGGNIRQAFFFRTDRGLAFVDRPGAGSTTANSVIDVDGQPQLQYSPGRIDPTNSAFNSSRKPLAAEFTYGGHHLIVIANHWNSKGGDDPLWGRDQPPVLSSEVQRQQQATIVRDFVQDVLAVDASAEVVVLGDLNDFEFSNPLMILKGAPMNDLIETLPANERYTYVFEGNSQTLDHILVSDSLLGVAHTDVVHVNSEFWDQASDHEPQVARFALFDSTPPVITAPANVTRGTGAGAASCGTFISDADLGTATATDDFSGVTVSRSGVPTGNLFPKGETTITYTATDSAGNTASATQLVTVFDNTPPVFTFVPANATYGVIGDVPPATASAATATDNCGSPSITVSESSNGGAGSPASPLILTRTFTATDSSGNTAQATQVITVADNAPPVFLAVPANITRGTGPGATGCGAIISDADLGTATATDNAGGVTITRTGVPIGNLFPVGATTVTYVATDVAGNTASATQLVTVNDTTSPTVTAPAAVTSGTGPGATEASRFISDADLGLATASDNCGVVTIARSAIPTGNLFPVGTTTITYTALDSAGNSASATQNVTVVDDTPPTISGAPTTGANANGWYNAAVTVHFTCTDNVAVATCEGDHVLNGDGAAQMVTGTATDTAGNTATTTVGPIRIDTHAPTITFAGSLIYGVDETVAISCTVVETLSGLDPAVTQTCPSASGPASSFGLGTHTLTASATDRAGNHTTATVTFTIGVDERSLCALTGALVTKDGVAGSLCAKLDAAAASASRGNTTAYDNQLAAYRSEVAAQTGKSITEANAAILIALSRAL